jgi:hypothetical protein
MTLRFANAAANRVTFKIMGNAAFSFWTPARVLN